jgi:hypothetical protein
MLAPTRALQTEITTAPGNNEFVVVLDSTHRLHTGTTASVATGSAYLAPGAYRNAWAGAIVKYTVRSTTQGVTALDQILTGNAGTAADWETQGASGTHAVTAGTTTVVEYKPLAADWRLVIQAGATGPSALVVQVSVTFGGSDFGS